MNSVTAIRRENGTYILNLFVKEHHQDKTHTRDIVKAISLLGDAMAELELTPIRIAKYGDFLVKDR